MRKTGKYSVRHILFFCLIFLVLQTLEAQQVSLTVSETTVGITENFTVKYTISGGARLKEQPDFKKFTVLAGPNQSSSYSNINGVSSRKLSLSYVLRPKELGSFVLPSITISTDQGELESNNVTIEVVKETPKTKREAEFIEQNIFIKTYISDYSPFIGEPFTVTYRLYCAANLQNLQVNSLPSFEGFYKVDLLDKVDQKKNEVIDGKEYLVYDIQKVQLIPQTHGKQILDVLELDVVIGVPSNRRDFFNRPILTQKSVSVSSKALSISINSIPTSNAPSGYTGAVGEFKASYRLSKDTIVQNESLDIIQTVEGTGNLKLFTLPELSVPKDFDKFSPKQSDNVRSTARGMSGKKELQHLLIPRFPGTYDIVLPSFCYFDLSSKTFECTEERKQQIVVLPATRAASKKSNQTFSGTPNKVDIDVLSKDILYVDSDTSLYDIKNKQSLGNVKLWYWIALFLLGAAGYYIISMLHSRRESSPEEKQKKAKKMALRKLSEARKHVKGEDTSVFYASLSDGLLSYAEDKLQLSAAERGTSNTLSALANKGASEEIILEWKTVLETCQAAQYAGKVKHSAPELLEQGIALILSTEEAIS